MCEVLIPTPKLTLGKVLVDALVEGLTPLTALGFLYEYGGTTPETRAALQKDVREHIVPSQRLRVVSDREGKPIAFVVSALHKTRYGNLYQLEGIIIHPDHQGKGLGRALLADEFAKTDTHLLGFQTQNRKMLDLGDQLAEMDIPYARELGPVIGTPQPELEYKKGEYLVVHRGRYDGQPLYADLNRYRESGMEIPGLNYLMGDAAVFVGPLRQARSTEGGRCE